MQDQRIAPARRRAGSSPAYAPIAIGSSRKVTYNSSMMTGPVSPAAATSYLIRPEADTVNNRA